MFPAIVFPLSLFLSVLYFFVCFSLNFTLFPELLYNTFVSKIATYLGPVNFEDKNFDGTVALRNEQLTLPDGSKAALGIDGDHWVLVYQKGGGAPFQVFEYDRKEQKIVLDKKPGGPAEAKTFRRIVAYFFQNAEVEDLVTILPPRS
jgi:hypothetical protein